MWLIFGHVVWVSWISHFSGPAAQHLRRSYGPVVWVSWILLSPGLLRSICVDVAGLRLKGADYRTAVWVSWILLSPGLLCNTFVVYCMWEIWRSFRISAFGSHMVYG
jgi:hypothetical protein